MLKSYCRKQKLKYRSEKKALHPLNGKGFTLAEAAAATMILAFICSGVLVVINRSMESAADVTLQMQAFEIARENMEQLLSTDSVKEYTDFGYSEEHPQIQWQTTVESFYEPITNRLWIQAVCTTEYADSKGELKKIELTHWLTDLSKKQILELLKEKGKEQDYLELTGQLIETLEEAAEYAGVDEETVEQWAENGMPITEDGYFIKIYLDLYKSSNGNPSVAQIEQTGEEFDDIVSGQEDGEGPEQKTDEPKVDCYTLPVCQRIPCMIYNGQEDLVTWDDIMADWRECVN